MGFKCRTENLPQELQDIARWGIWKFDGKRKVPVNTSGYPCDPKTNLFSFGEAKKIAQRLGSGQDIFGLRFHPSRNDNIVLADCDSCISKGELTPVGQRFYEQWKHSYIEKSPSGKGLRAVGTVPIEKKKAKTEDGLPLYKDVPNGKLPIEMFFTGEGNSATLTGESFNGNTELSDCEPIFMRYLLDYMYTQYGTAQGLNKVSWRDVPYALTDKDNPNAPLLKPDHIRPEEIISRSKSERPSFYNGTLLKEKGGDKSNFEAALIWWFGIKCGGDVEATINCIRDAGFERDKWKEQRSGMSWMEWNCTRIFAKPEFQEAVRKEYSPAPRLSLQLISAGDLYSADLTVQEIIGGGVLVADTNGAALGGGKRMHKTNIGLGMAVTIAADAEDVCLFNSPHFPVMKHGKVLYLSRECYKTDIVARQTKIANAHNLTIEQFYDNVHYSFAPVRLSDPEWLVSIKHEFDQDDYLVVICDSWYRLQGSAAYDQSNAGAASEIIDSLLRVCTEYETTCLFMHHTVKEAWNVSKNFGDLNFLAYTGLTQVVRQGCILNRREEFDRSANLSELGLGVDTTLTSGGEFVLNIDEGSQREKWECTVTTTEGVVKSDQLLYSDVERYIHAKKLTYETPQGKLRHGITLNKLHEALKEDGKGSRKDKLQGILDKMIVQGELICIESCLDSGRRPTKVYFVRSIPEF